MDDLRRQGVPPDALEGTPYRPVSLLGKGGMAYVLEADDTRDGRRVVVKILQPASALDDTTAARFRAEAAILSDLRHPNLVEVHDSGVTTHGHGYLVMERLHGHDFRDELKRRGALPVAYALELARQALAGLEALHRRGIIHRDVKPGNLFLCDHPDGGLAVKVVDLGIAKLTKDAEVASLSRRRFTSPGELVGTPWYMAPELLLERPASPAVDVYAMGLVLYRMLTGQHPFADCRELDAMWLAHLSKEPQPPSTLASQSIPVALDRVVMRCLAKEPDERYADATELSAALGRVVSALASPDAAREPPPATAATVALPATPDTAATRVDGPATRVDTPATAPRDAPRTQPLHTRASAGVAEVTSPAVTAPAAPAPVAQAYAPPVAAPVVPQYPAAVAARAPAARESGRAGRVLASIVTLAALPGVLFHGYGTAACVVGMVDPTRVNDDLAGARRDVLQTAKQVLAFELPRHALLTLFALGLFTVAVSLVRGRRSRVSDSALPYAGAVCTIIAALVLDLMNNGPRHDLMASLGDSPLGASFMLTFSIVVAFIHVALVGLLLWASRATPRQAPAQDR